jgi:hypothetical protein
MQTKFISKEAPYKSMYSCDSSNKFLCRIEKQRLKDECLYPLDLRPYVAGPCKHFSYRGRSLWLDAVAHHQFLAGLNNNAGVFTVETYEAILDQCSRASGESRQLKPNRTQENTENELVTRTSASTILESDQALNKLTIDLSYFERRVYDRFKIPLILILNWNGKQYKAETRDISKTGIQLRLNVPIDVELNDTVTINISPLLNCKLDHLKICYRVVRIRRLLKDTLLGLQCIENNAKDGLTVINDFVTAARNTAPSDHADPQDALLTAQTLLAERFYMRSTSILPFFLFERSNSTSPLKILFSNQVNQHFLDVFKNINGSYDFSSLVTPTRIKLLTRLAMRDSKAETLIAVYRTSQYGSPQVKADLECKNHKHWYRLLLTISNQSIFRIFKIVARLARHPVDMRIEDALKPLNDNNMYARQLIGDAKNLTIVGALIDVTNQFDYSTPDRERINSELLEQPVICHADEQPYAPPTLVPIHYIQENRSEDRYLGKIDVELVIAGLLYKGVTHDVSHHGLSIALNDPYAPHINHNQAIISFPKLEKAALGRFRLKGIFKNVPAQLVGGPTHGEQLLHFKICDSDKGKQFAKAFSEILEKRLSNLNIDESHALRAATSRLYSSIFIESSSTLPLFVYQKSQNDWSLKFGISTSPTPLVDYFEVADGKFDFSVFTHNNRLQHLIQQVTEYGSSEIILYLCKERCRNSPTFKIRSIIDNEIDNETIHKQYLNQQMNHNFRCIKVILNRPHIPPKEEIDQAIDRLIQLSPRKCERIKEDFTNLVAIGDIFDITGLIADLYPENR